MAYLLSETFKFPKDNFESMKYQPYELKPNFSMYRIYEWHRYWDGKIYLSFSGGLDSTVLGYEKLCKAELEASIRLKYHSQLFYAKFHHEKFEIVS